MVHSLLLPSWFVGRHSAALGPEIFQGSLKRERVAEAHTRTR